MTAAPPTGCEEYLSLRPGVYLASGERELRLLSRFAVLRREGDRLVVESPLAPAMLLVPAGAEDTPGTRLWGAHELWFHACTGAPGCGVSSIVAWYFARWRRSRGRRVQG